MSDLRKWIRIIEDHEGYRPPINPLTNPAFRRWFGDSKAIDQNGDPLVCYHGTKNDFDTFDPSLTGTATDHGWFGPGIYLSPYARESSDYAQRNGYAPTLHSQGHVMPLYVRALNPYITDHQSMSPSYAQEIRDEGHDAIFRVGYRGEMPQEIVVFSPHQVKSAIGNNGAFSSDDPRIQETRDLT